MADGCLVQTVAQLKSVAVAGRLTSNEFTQ